MSVDSKSVQKRKAAQSRGFKPTIVKVEADAEDTRLVLGHKKHDSWIRLDLTDGRVSIASGNIDGTPSMSLKQLRKVIQWLEWAQSKIETELSGGG